MLKKALGLVIAVVMLLGVFSLTACDNDTLDAYKVAGKAAIETYAQERKDNYCEDNWTVVCGIVEAGKQAVDVAQSKTGVDTAVNDAKEKIRTVQINNTFPSVLGNFDLGEFTNEFFEDNTLILVPFEWSYLLYEHLNFYTAFAENGKLNFLIEVTDPNGLGDAAIDMRVFAVIVPNAVFNSLEIGEIRVFETYDFSAANPTENSRDLLSGAEEKSVEHRVSYVYYNSTSTNFPALSNPIQLKRGVAGITVITLMENLQEYFSI